ncbi:LysR family transcriptional regulator [Terriglobus saanensis]|uniref:Transcriptional regulator, LysR family n=1 Tax=Terriglobus saanensis (strain ATCC BAA-1853 / DSM 23119 / SP1PR4) TaxID=401053 RepID=E8V5D1_TERSS|nr:LysR family transcriptional regulator [Terriglobus saanensis]ADV84890.1 transcriptional regulator, LysR family [Terriglobus saanensis SP1PR4]
MELRHLRYFVAVAEQKGFREASRFLHISQPAISKTVTQLEQELGINLFARSGRTVRMTPQGQVFYQETLRTLKQSDYAAEAAQRADRGETGTLTLGFCSVATAGFLPGIVRKYKELLPGVRLLLKEMNPTQQEAAFSQGEIDIGITRPPFAKKLARELEVKTIFREPLLVAVPSGHAFTAKKIKFESLSEEPFILLHRDGAPTVHDAILGMGQTHGFSPKVAYESDALQTIFTLVAGGQGIAIVPMCALNLRPEGIRFLRLQPDDYRAELILAWPKNSQVTVVKPFIHLIEQERKEIGNQARRLLQAAFAPAK